MKEQKVKEPNFHHLLNKNQEVMSVLHPKRKETEHKRMMRGDITPLITFTFVCVKTKVYVSLLDCDKIEI